MRSKEFKEFLQHIDMLGKAEQALALANASKEDREYYRKLRRGCLLVIEGYVRRAWRDEEDQGFPSRGNVVAEAPEGQAASNSGRV
jgi:hypothetical protein